VKKYLPNKHSIENQDSTIRELKNEFLGLLRTSISINLEDKVKFVTRLDTLSIDQIKSGIEILNREIGIKERHYESYSSFLELKKIEWPLVLKTAQVIREVKP